ERLMRPDFGCGIFDFTFDTMSYNTLSKMKKSVSEALILWEPRIRDVEVEVEQDGQESGRLNISIRYVVRSTNNPYNLVYPFYINEGME
ncbi:MAG: GPW/gp25 family protein, partial [Anaerovorax sp.]